MKIPSKVYPYRLPYMGSKQNIAYSIMMAIVQKKPKAKYFFDIFGGGAAMSLMAKQFGLKVYYTEKNAGIVNLLNFLKDNKIPKDWIRWINRDEFKQCVGKDDPFSVFVTVVWSFGNNRQAYLFGKDIEELKRLGFEVIVHQDYSCLEKLKAQTGLNLKMPTEPNLHDRRLNFSKQIKIKGFIGGGMQPMKRVEEIQQIAMNQSLTQIECCSRLQQLEYLQQLELPYDEVIIYCDPPYRGTAEYTDNDFNHHEFDDWVRKLKYDVFISEYNTPFEKIASFNKLALLNNSKEKKDTVSENLYFHKAERIENENN